MQFQAVSEAHRRFITDPVRPIFVLIAIAACVRILMTFGTTGILWPDSFAYHRSAALMAKFGNFHWHEIYRTPLYPIFMAPFLWLFGQTALAGFFIILGQRLLGIASVVLLYKVSRKNFSPAVAFYGSLLFAIHTLQLYYETTVHTETLFTFFLLLVIYATDFLFKDPAPRNACLVGLLCGLLTLTRPLGQFVLLIILGLLLLRERFSLTWWKCCGASILVFVAVLLPWMLTNKAYYKFFGVSQDLGLNLFHRIIDVERIPPLENTAHPRVLRVWKASKHNKITYFYVYHGLLRERVRRVKADRMMAAFAIETLKQDGGKYFLPYLKNSAETFFEFFFKVRRSVQFCGDAGGPYLCTKNTLGRKEKAFANSPENLGSSARAIIYEYFRLFRLPMGAISLVAMVGFVMVASRWRKAELSVVLMMAVTIYFALLTAVFNIPEDRFRLPIDPILFVFAVFAVTSFVLYYIRGKRGDPKQACINSHET
ncbi:MAG: glycosyltransferase family 39 protein [Deltaproteobacteria bacterium]|nr:glycosyltransferase family 39 protein [Deltaproteobacteria bacterium]